MTTTATHIWCPDWCTASEEWHQQQVREELADGYDPEPIHHGEPRGVVDGETYSLSAITKVDGTPAPDPGHAPVMLVAANSELVHPNDLERHAHLLLDLVAQARAAQKERVR